MHYLSEMSEEQTLVMYSGHPMGLYPSHPNSPRVVITNGMVRHCLSTQSPPIGGSIGFGFGILFFDTGKPPPNPKSLATFSHYPGDLLE